MAAAISEMTFDTQGAVSTRDGKGCYRRENQYMYTAQNGEQLSCVYGKTLFQHLFSLRSCEKGQIYSLGSGLTQNMDTFFPPNMSSFQSQMVLFKKKFY